MKCERVDDELDCYLIPFDDVDRSKRHPIVGFLDEELLECEKLLSKCEQTREQTTLFADMYDTFQNIGTFLDVNCDGDVFRIKNKYYAVLYHKRLCVPVMRVGTAILENGDIRNENISYSLPFWLLKRKDRDINEKYKSLSVPFHSIVCKTVIKHLHHYDINSENNLVVVLPFECMERILLNESEKYNFDIILSHTNNGERYYKIPLTKEFLFLSVFK